MSVKLRIAESLVGCAFPMSTDELAGDIAKPVGAGGSTWNGELPVMGPDAAVTVTVPGLSVVSSPVELTVANVGSELDQLAVASGLVVPSEKLPIAVSCCASPAATDAFGTVTIMDCRVAASIRKGALPLREPDAAITVTVPLLSVVSNPLEVIVASVVSDVDQLTVASNFVVPSE